MKRLISIKSNVLVLITLVISSFGFAQDTEVAPKIDRPIYEDLGMSSTSLFTIMLLFTTLLIILLIAVINSTKNVYGFNRSKSKVKTNLLILGVGLSTTGFSQTGIPAASGTDALISFPDSAFWAFMILDIIVIMLILYFVGLMRGALTQYAPAKKPQTIFSRWNKALTNAVEIENEGSILLDHDYDGIKELDNDLPPWWKYGFYVTIVWGVVYFSVYHVFMAAPLQAEEYQIAVAESEKEKAEFKESNPNIVTEETAKLLTEAGDLAKGQKVYEAFCVSCHLPNGGGQIGPNLTDKYWIYDGDIKGVFHTISEGANNGMAAWKDILNGEKIEAVASYILSLPEAEGGKSSEGENVFE